MRPWAAAPVGQLFPLPLGTPLTACTVVNALVHSKLDYYNSLYYNLPKYQLDRLQRIQNSLARTVVSSLMSHLSSNLFIGSKFENALITKSALSLLIHFILPNLFTFEVSSTSKLLGTLSHLLASYFLVHTAHSESKPTTAFSVTVQLLSGITCAFLSVSYLISVFTLRMRPFYIITSSCIRHYIIFQTYILPVSHFLSSLALPISRRTDTPGSVVDSSLFAALSFVLFCLYSSFLTSVMDCAVKLLSALSWVHYNLFVSWIELVWFVEDEFMQILVLMERDEHV